MKKIETTVLEWDEIEAIVCHCWGQGYWIEACDRAREAIAAGKKAVFITASSPHGVPVEVGRQIMEIIATTFGENGPVYYDREGLDRGYPVLILPKELRNKRGDKSAESLTWLEWSDP